MDGLMERVRLFALGMAAAMLIVTGLGSHFDGGIFFIRKLKRLS